ISAPLRLCVSYSPLPQHLAVSFPLRLKLRDGKITFSHIGLPNSQRHRCREVLVLFSEAHYIHRKRATSLALSIFLLLIPGCGKKKDEYRNGRLVIQYWEKWTGFEGEAMQDVVDAFNASQDEIWVEKITSALPVATNASAATQVQFCTCCIFLVFLRKLW
ncbi:MAG: hypothetical protein KAX38_02110, partial [Candidatus Krumholzibacteria bacterium]|nr:hypothetical protein [Candidatus Krumholzibacteria bacterium]